MDCAHHHHANDNAVLAGSLYFEPHIPSIIHETIGGFIGASKYGAHDFKITKNSIRFLIDAHHTKCNASQVSIIGYCGVWWSTFDLYCYDEKGNCVFSKFCFDKSDLYLTYNSI